MPQNNLPVTTFLACKNAMLREGIRHILTGTRYSVRGDAPVGMPGAPADPTDGAPVLFILDANLHHRDTPSAIRRLKEEHAGSRVVVLADSFNMEDMLASLNAGAGGYCLATSGCDALIKYLDLVMLGETVFPAAMFFSAMAGQSEAASAQRPSAAVSLDQVQAVTASASTRMLSTREAEILHCLMEGAPNKTIARRLEVAEATVKVHVKAILRKIRVTNRTQAAMWAVAHLSGANGSDHHVSPS